MAMDNHNQERRNYTVSLTFNFDAESMEEAAELFRERLIEGGFTVLVVDDETGESDDL
jgi:hypothetical protein